MASLHPVCCNNNSNNNKAKTSARYAGVSTVYILSVKILESLEFPLGKLFFASVGFKNHC